MPNANPPTKFSAYTVDLLEIHFKVFQTEPTPLLKEWLGAQAVLTKEQTDLLAKYQELLTQKVDNWNEFDLQVNFIGPTLNAIDFFLGDVNPFFQRKMSAVIDGHKIGGVTDWTLAVGKSDPRHPFFFLHEYKPQTNPTGDPKGQLLIEMLAAQTLNGDNGPMFGCYVIGVNWYFVVLENRRYAVSQPLLATNGSLNQIAGCLQYIKQRVLKWLETADLRAIPFLPK